MSSKLYVEDALDKDPVTRKAQLSLLARHAEQAERYEDMCKFMKSLVSEFCSGNAGLTVEERNLVR